MINILSKHFFLKYKITYKKFKFSIFLKKRLLYNNLNRNILKNYLNKFLKLKNLNFYGYKIILKLKYFYDKNKYFNLKKYFNFIFLIEVLTSIKKIKNFIKI